MFIKIQRDTVNITKLHQMRLLSVLLGLYVTVGSTPVASAAVAAPTDKMAPLVTTAPDGTAVVPSVNLPPTARENPYESPVQERVDITRPTFNGRTIAVQAGEDLQGAIDSANPGDVIELEPGAVFTGTFVLPEKKNPDAEWILIRTSGMQPPEGQRIDPAVYSASMAVIQSPDRRPFPAIKTSAGASFYRFENLTIRAHPDPSDFKYRVYNLVELSDGINPRKSTPAWEHQPHHIIFDRTYVHGNSKIGTRRGFAFNGRHLAVINSYLTEFKERGADSQAICGWRGSGPFRIENNFLAGAGENIMFGGSDARIENLVPSDIEILRNHFVKPLRWRQGDPAYEGTRWVIKNLFELKSGQRVLVEGNIFENNWGGQGQGGHAVLFTPRTERGKNPWVVVQDVLFQHNTLKNIAQGFNIMGKDNHAPNDTPSNNIVIHNNLFENVGAFETRAYWLKLIRTIFYLTISHNTVRFAGSDLNHGIALSINNPKSGEVAQVTHATFVDNVIEHQQYGFNGDRLEKGANLFETNFPGLNMSGNFFLKKPGDTRNLARRYAADSGFMDNTFVEAGESPDPGDAGVDMERLLQKQQKP